MPITFYNHWRLEVLEAIHTWPNRYVVSGATVGSGTYDPIVGSVQLIDGPVWVLDAQHQPPGGDWTSSAMQQQMVLGLEHVNLHLLVGAEDPLPFEDFRDIRLSCIFLGGRMFEIPYRPFAVRTSDLMQMPDGVFEARLGTYYMGVRLTNRWGMPFTSNNVIDITPASRGSLALQGIQVLDNWSPDELDALGQQVTPQGIVIGALVPGQSRTVYFKVDVSNARARKHEVEFICRNTAGMADPDHIGRKVKQLIYVSKIEYDSASNEYRVDAPQGTLHLHIEQVAIDYLALRRSLRKARRQSKESPRCADQDLQRLRTLLQDFQSGQNADLCEIQRLLACCCGADPRPPTTGLDPFYLILTRFGVRIVPKAPYGGQFGEIPYDDPWWKLLLALIALILALIGALEEGAQSAYEDEDLVIGRLHDSERHQLDAALCRLDTSRELGFQRVLDAQSGESNNVPVVPDNLGGTVTITPEFMTQSEVDELFAEADDTGNMDGLRVFKSGARTGTTFAQLAAWAGPWQRCDLAPEGDCDDAPEEITRFDDPDRPNLRFEAAEGADPNSAISDRGDSGSVWIHFDSKRPIALNHSGSRDANTATATLLQFIADRFGITF